MLDNMDFSPCRIRGFYLCYHSCSIAVHSQVTEEDLLPIYAIIIGILGCTRQQVYFGPKMLQYL
jgi:hypothetical protein